MEKKNFILHDEEKLVKVLTGIQTRWFFKDTRDDYVRLLITEEWDWAVVYAWLIDNHVIKAPKQRPPIAQFVEWLQLYPDWKYIPTPKDLSRAIFAWNTLERYRRNELLYNTITKLFYGEPEAVSRQTEQISRKDDDFETLLNLLRTPSCPQLFWHNY